jgi:hypothetical protein
VIWSQRDLGELMTCTDYVEAITEDFNFSPRAVASPPLPIEIARQYGTFLVKAGSLSRGPGYMAVKINGNFPGNKASPGSIAWEEHSINGPSGKRCRCL